ncbi:unnamed protein product [Candida parapsilosis]|uniref:Uncharacterized protein n=1 Tax=Candida parapsilosis (strain CDC 317 / ATCC MYA-4646) TaxID=578454 RepID=G8BGG1_CANPC|nr:uncharacterized protein CPAR2_205875 [Candida parapsilosis]CAD1808481.1 unnamed protein product [Candida parapsilosis]CCE42945.1 hypothetical protein CPAR2_205875 [Candida parapsilosis]
MCPSNKIDIQNSLRRISNFLKRGFSWSLSGGILFVLKKMATSITWKHLHYLVVANFSLIYFLIKEERRKRENKLKLKKLLLEMRWFCSHRKKKSYINYIATK